MMTLRALGLAALATSGAACMLSPTDDGIVSNTTSTLTFDGYLTQPGAQAFVRAWNYDSNAMEDLGAPVLSSTSGLNVEGGPLYYWSAPRALPARYWRNGPGGGQCAVVGAQTLYNGARYNAMTVEDNWADCWNANPTVGDFYNRCRSNNNPVAKIYTSSWGPATINQTLLNLAGAIASSQISLVFDNFTPTQGQFCNSTNPGGCPPGLSADPCLPAGARARRRAGCARRRRPGRSPRRHFPHDQGQLRHESRQGLQAVGRATDPARGE